MVKNQTAKTGGKKENAEGQLKKESLKDHFKTKMIFTCSFLLHSLDIFMHNLICVFPGFASGEFLSKLQKKKK